VQVFRVPISHLQYQHDACHEGTISNWINTTAYFAGPCVAAAFRYCTAHRRDDWSKLPSGWPYKAGFGPMEYNSSTREVVLVCAN